MTDSMKRLIFTFALIVATSLGGCSSTTDTSDDTLSYRPMSTRAWVTSMVGEALGTKCKRSNAACRKKRAIEDAEERKEARQRAEILQRAFDNRAQTTDTAEMIEQQRRKNDWIINSQEQQPAVVTGSDEFE